MIIQLPEKKYAVLGESQTCAADTKDEKAHNEETFERRRGYREVAP